jgi:hypothetical protein
MIKIEELLLGEYIRNDVGIVLYIPSRVVKRANKIFYRPPYIRYRVKCGDFCFLLAHNGWYYGLPVKYFLENSSVDIFFASNRLYTLLPIIVYKDSFRILNKD